MDSDLHIDRRGKSMWYTYTACVVLFPIAAYFYGPLALLIGIVGTAIGIERVAAIWSANRRKSCIAFLVWVGFGAVSMFVPIWGHNGVHPEDRKAISTHHDHHLWERDHVH